MADLLEKLQPGTKWRVFFNPGNTNNKLVHIRAVVDDCVIVSKFWSYGKQSWVYEIDHVSWFQMLDDGGHLRKAK